MVNRAKVLILVLAMMATASAVGDVQAKSKAAKKPTTSAREQAVVKSPYFVKATQAYQKGNYRDAISNFELCDRSGGCCQWTHYYLGLSYQGINQLGPAYQHFQWVLARGTDPSLRRYSQYASDSLSYYASNRTYNGQGAIASFSRASGGGGGGGGSSGRG